MRVSISLEDNRQRYGATDRMLVDICNKAFYIDEQDHLIRSTLRLSFI